ncbi:MAG: 3-phosphoshikimate 1-carboxyvinyltransferase [Bacteroidota bacterium]
MTKSLRAVKSLSGTIIPPPDKSVAHRAALFSAIASGTSHIHNFSDAADPQSTLRCLEMLGIGVEKADDVLTIHGRGLHGFTEPHAPLDCGNSGTTMRLLAGILAGQHFPAELTGDQSLLRRPMSRIAEPLTRMGANIELSGGLPPIQIRGSGRLESIRYDMPVASAQVKSCVLLAGLFGDGQSMVVEQHPTRDHTERMLGLSILEVGGKRQIAIDGGMPVPARKWIVPGDFSAAAFFLVAASIVPDSKLFLKDVGLNPSRSAFLDVLIAMGGDISVSNEREHGGEPIADLTVRSAELSGVSIGGSIIPNLIDEIPALAVAAACAHGRTELRDAGELRVKESDRIELIVRNLTALGCEIHELEDGFVVEGGRPLSGGPAVSDGDHRIAMAMGVAALVASGETTIAGAEAASVSYPGFWDDLRHVSGRQD